MVILSVLNGTVPKLQLLVVFQLFEVVPDQLLVGITVKINSPLEIDNAPVVFAAKPEPPILSAPIVPVTPVADPLLAINLQVPTAKAVVVVTVIGALFNTNSPAEALVTVNAEVTPPAYELNAKPPEDSVKFFELATVIVPVVLLPVDDDFNHFLNGLTLNTKVFTYIGFYEKNTKNAYFIQR